MRNPLRAAFFFLLFLFSTFPFSSFASQEQNGDWIVTGSIGDAHTLIPILASDSASSDITGLIFNGLVKYGPTLNLVGDLAENWEIGKGGLEIIFHLRKNVRWHDGAAFTAEDVQFTYQKLIDPKVRTPYSSPFERIERLEILDPYTVKVVYKEPYAPALESWGMGILPKHLLEKEDLHKTDFARHPVGTGLFQFEEWRTAERITLRPNPSYFEGKPRLGRYVYRIIPDQATMFLELRTQGIDIMGLSPLQYRRQTQGKFFEKNYRIFRYPAFAYTYVGFNLADPRFSDKRVRLAIDLAINKQELIDGILLGLGKICTGPFPQESWAFNSEVPPAPYDPQKSKALLKEAGWSDQDGDGVIEKEGHPFEFTLITNQGNDERKMAAEIIQRRLSEVGIRMKIKVIEWSAFISEFVDKRRFDALLLGWSLGRDPDLYDIFHSSKTKEGEFNFIGYKNAEVDRLLEEGRGTFDQEKRKEIYHRLHALLYEEKPYIFLWVPDSLPIVHSRFEGVKPAPIGIGYNLREWVVPQGKERYAK